jgi:hypothetical protein
LTSTAKVTSAYESSAASALALRKMVPSWVKRIPLFPLLFTYVFVGSTCLVAVAMVALCVVWPFSKNAYRWISSALAYSVLTQQFSL